MLFQDTIITTKGDFLCFVNPYPTNTKSDEALKAVQSKARLHVRAV